MIRAASKPELIRGLSFADYCDMPGVNATTLMTYRDCSPCESRHLQLYDVKQTQALVRGHAAHAAVLEPESFERDFAVMPAFGDYRTKAAREQRDRWLEAHKDSITLDDDDYRSASAMRDSLLGNEFTAPLFTGKGLNELTVKWVDAETGLPCKARIDRLTQYHGYETLLDLKTARDIDDGSLQKAIVSYGYHIRMAWYLDALSLVRPGNFRVFLVWALNRPPWLGRVTELEDDDLEEGRLQYRAWLNLHARCTATNSWPGYAAGVEPLGLPPWAFRLHIRG